MGAGTTLIAFMILIIIGAVVIQQLGLSTVDILNQSTNFLNAYKLQPNIQPGERLCDISITTFADLIGPNTLSIEFGVVTDPFVQIENNVRSYQWFNCRDPTAVPFLSLVGNLFETEDLNIQSLDFLTIFGIEIQPSIQLSSPGSFQTIGPDLNPSLKKLIKVPAGNVPSPFDLDQTYLISNIPERNYDLKIFYDGKQIRTPDGTKLPFNSPFNSNICKSGLSSC